MRNFEEFTENLQQDIEVPEHVWNKFEETLSNLPEKQIKRPARHYRLAKTAVAAAAVIAVGIGVLYANPVLASKIPVIGKIFEQVENDVTFSGDFNKKETLTEENEQNPELIDGKYTVEGQGVKITASEIYCDGYSIFLTARIQAEAGGFTNIPAHYTSRFTGEDETTAQGIYTRGSWNVEGREPEALMNDNFEGKVLDDNTYIGMIKIDLGEFKDTEGILNLNLSGIAYDDLNAIDSEDISASHEMEGNWNLSVPFQVDTQTAKTIPIDKETADGYGISKIFLSPYQLVVYMDVPYTTLEEEGFTREEFDEMWAEKTEGMDVSEPPFTYEEYIQEKHYAYCELAVFNQDGEALVPREADEEKSVFAVKDIDISALHIFLSSDEENAIDLMKATDMKEAEGMALLRADVDIK